MVTLKSHSNPELLGLLLTSVSRVQDQGGGVREGQIKGAVREGQAGVCRLLTPELVYVAERL